MFERLLVCVFALLTGRNTLGATEVWLPFSFHNLAGFDGYGHPRYNLPVGSRPAKRRFYLRRVLSQDILNRLIRGQLISQDAVALQDAA